MFTQTTCTNRYTNVNTNHLYRPLHKSDDKCRQRGHNVIFAPQSKARPWRRVDLQKSALWPVLRRKGHTSHHCTCTIPLTRTPPAFTKSPTSSPVVVHAVLPTEQNKNPYLPDPLRFFGITSMSQPCLEVLSAVR
jgi:hypothetical protein